MSVVTNLVLTFSSLEDEELRITEVNSFQYGGLNMNLISADYNKDIDRRYSWYGGTKFLERPLYIGAFNHLNLDEFITHLKQIKWDAPESVQIIVKDQFDEKFRIVELL